MAVKSKKTVKKKKPGSKTVKKTTARKTTVKKAVKKTVKKKTTAKKAAPRKKTAKASSAKKTVKKKAAVKKTVSAPKSKSIVVRRPSVPAVTEPMTIPPAAPPEWVPPSDHEYIGKMTHFYNHLMVGIVVIEAGDLLIGDTVHIKGHTTDLRENVGSIELEHQPVQRGAIGQSVGIKVTGHVREHDKVYKIRK